MKTSVKFSLRSSLFWNAVYVARIALYLLGLTGFSFILSPLAFLLQCVHLPWRRTNRVFRALAGIFSLGLFYHDSFLPGWEQLLAQRANLTGFSLSYMADFLVSFVNPYMVAGFVIIIAALKLISRLVRAPSFILIAMLALPFVNTDALRALYEQNDMIAVNQGFLNQVGRDDEALLDQRGNFTKSNLERYLNRFHEREAKRAVSFPGSLESDFSAFNIVMVSVDGFSSRDLEQSQALEHAALKRFDIVLSNFNSATTDPQTARIRLLTSGCGQVRNADLLKPERFEKCSLLATLGRLGYTSGMVSDDFRSAQSLLQRVADQTGQRLNLAIPEEKPSADGRFAVRTLFDTYIATANAAPAPLAVMIDVTALAGAASVADYDAKLKAFLLDVNRFIDDLEMNGRPTLLLLIPERGSGMTADRTQMAGSMEIPSFALTHGRVFAKFVGLEGHHKRVESDEPVSYMAVAELISRSIAANIFDPDLMPSFLALTDGLSRTAYIGENANFGFMIFKGRMFYKDDPAQNNWAEYQQ